ncbi:MAG: VTT domain-containing protein [Terriglobia bacterium]
MNLDSSTGFFAYLAIFLAAAIEGEIVFVAASVLVSLGKLDPFGVFAAGALGGSAGDQVFYFLGKGRLWHLLDRFPAVARKGKLVAAKVQKHATGMILASRFLPGLRIAIPLACAYSKVKALRFCFCNLLSAMAWSGSILILVAWGGPNAISRLGITAWWAPIVPALLIIGLFYTLERKAKRQNQAYAGSQPAQKS